MSFESELQEWLAGRARDNASDRFAYNSVVINDWDFKDDSGDNSPYVLIADSVDVEYDTLTTNMVVRATIVVIFDGWKETLDTFRDAREDFVRAILGQTQQLGGKFVAVNKVYNGGEIVETYDPSIDRELQPMSLPIFISQQMNIHVETGAITDD